MFCEKKISATMRERKRLGFAFNIKAMDNSGRFAGYASVFNVVDNQMDVVKRGAFSATLKGRISDIKLLWQHQQDEPIGIIETLFEDERGLYIEGKLLLNVQRALEAYTLLKEGAISGLSIGYSPLRYAIDPKSGVRLLSEVDLWEVSLVTFPANDAANVTVIKQFAEWDWKRAVSSGEIVELASALDNAIATLSYS